jgi:D-alanine-D-alanine ligase
LSKLDAEIVKRPDGGQSQTPRLKRSVGRAFSAFDAAWSIERKRAEAIEIVVAPQLADVAAHRKNVGIELDEALVLKILSTRYSHVSITEIHTRRDLEQMAVRRPHLVFSGVKYFSFDGRDLWLNDFLDRHGIAYMASNKAALDNEHDKVRAKRIMQIADIATADYFSTAPGEHPTADSIPLAFPIFVKPVDGGDSRGVDADSVVHDFESFRRKVRDIHETQMSRALAETYLPGREYSVGILEDAHSGTLRAMPIEIIAAPNRNGDRVLDYEMKKQDAENVEPVTDPAVRSKLGELAKSAFRALGGKSFGRIDIKMNDENAPHFVEANLMPGLRKGYFFRSCLLNLDMSYDEMILTIAGNGLATSRLRREVRMVAQSPTALEPV